MPPRSGRSPPGTAWSCTSWSRSEHGWRTSSWSSHGRPPSTASPSTPPTDPPHEISERHHELHARPRPARGTGIAATLSSEWRKLWALPSNRGILIAAFGLSIGITLLMTAFGDTEAIGREQDESRYSVIFFGSTLAVWVFCALAANIVAAEYRSG